jgi:LPPG:FO 2-phospho-L-lactate transferase
MVRTDRGMIAFQDYFVRHGQADEVRGIRLDGVDEAHPSPAALAALGSAELVVIGPSNPIVSIGPILAVAGYRDALGETNALVIAISPIIGGKALKGPADRMLASLGHESSALGVARIYAGLIDGFVIDDADRDQTAAIEALGIRVLATDAIMHDVPDRGRLAHEAIAFGESLKVKAPA